MASDLKMNAQNPAKSFADLTQFEWTVTQSVEEGIAQLV
jgi:hypothetical protein